ncbi:MAG: hypothetical protein PHH26_08970 [Candidatus Thermoplasmatota archaeon]|nr:hypothetical protein [Candidatus Thermoplasmatota archaeon]
MSAHSLQDLLTEEIRKIPESRFAEVFDFVHYFRLGLEAAETPARPAIENDAIAAFCGSGRGGSVQRLLADRKQEHTTG